MVLLFNLLFLVLILRLSFEKKMMTILLYKKWPGLITIQHLIFWLAFVLLNSYLYLQLFGLAQGIYRLLFMLAINIPLYHLCYSKLVPEYYQTKKYAEYIRYTAVVFVISCLLRILIEPEVFSGNPISLGTLLLLVYVTQTIIILIASLLGISKYKMIVENELARLEILKKEADLDLMKSKINPHFLFNTLNNIYSHSYATDISSANLIKQLSLLLQYTTYETGKKRIVVDKEIQMIAALSSLYQLKHNRELNLDFNYVAEDLYHLIEIPPTIYFTLFENAIKHSALGADQKAFIHAGLVLTGDRLIFTITNYRSALQQKDTVHNYNGVGLTVLKTIMNLEYPDNFELQVTESETEYSTVLTINI
ncbi:sensor histidine kinase [Pedobacter sp. AW31-3R]|uniref:sensor histidine kinase n=1 Tax=Pedobacter sp. AW31-3R TaxID=3445781 RepID=UPI003F9F2891